MKSLIAALCFCAFILPLNAQHSHYDPCATDNAERELLEKFPEQKQYFEKLDSFTKQFIADYQAVRPGQRRGYIYTIPVVFHIVHNYGNEYITDDQVYNAMEIINEDFRKRNADISQVVAQFQPIAADCEIEFKLATIDPWHRPTNGIDRIHSMQTYLGENESKLNPWPRDMYLNIWATYQVQQSDNAGITLAYAYRPPSVEGGFGIYDGIVTLSNCVGSIGTGSLQNSRTLTHEIGHYLNLNHTWGNNPNPGEVCGDDGIDDTPITDGGFNCVLTDISCTRNNPSPVVENTQNFMNYSTCPRMFTDGQKLAMVAALNNDIASRNDLWQESNLQRTGAAVSINRNTVAPPVADFNSPVRMACVGEQVDFKDFSWRGPISQWEWSFSNATPALSSAENPSVIFNTPGWQTVSLRVTSTLGSHEIVKEKYIYVTDMTQSSPRLFRDNFENPDEVVNSWVVNNVDDNTTRWQISNAASYTGGYSLMLNNFQGSYDRDEIITPTYDLVNNGVTDLNFKYSYASKSGEGVDGLNDTLTIFYSLNCGKTWSQVYRESGSALLTAGNFVYNFVPDRPELWKNVSVALPSLATASPNVRFKFRFSNGGSANNIYIDNINVNDGYYSTVGVNDPTPVASFSVFPVPSSGKFTIELSAFENSTVHVELTDMFGKNIANEVHNVHSGTTTIPMQRDLPTGIYTVSVSSKGGERMVKKMSIVR